MKFFCCFLVIILSLMITSARAGETCYSPAQMQAEQLLRLHSELMVITVTCRQSSEGEDLAAAYGSFTHQNIAILHEAEKTMIDYYRTNTKGDATEHLDRLRTLLGNEFGQKSANMSAPKFCDAYRDKVIKFNKASTADIENEAQRMVIAERSYVKPCTPMAMTAVK